MLGAEIRQIRTEAQRERDRLERQAQQARGQVRAEAARLRMRIAHEARTAEDRARRESAVAKEEARKQAVIEKDKVRGLQSIAEKEAHSVMAQAREAQLKELRKLDLPITKPEDLGVEEYIKEVDVARREAHKEGREARKDIAKARDDYFAKVDEARDKALAQIAEQKEGVEADIAKGLVKAEAEIAKQYAALLSGVAEWEKDASAKLEKAQKDYMTTLGGAVMLPDGMMMVKSDFDTIPEPYQKILVKDGYDAFREAFEADHLKLPDGQWINKDSWNELLKSDKEHGTGFTVIGVSRGYDAMIEAIDKQNKEYRNFLEKVKGGEIIETGDGQWIDRDKLETLPTGSQQILKEEGFAALERAAGVHWERLGPPKGTKFQKWIGWFPRDRTGEFIPHKEYQNLSLEEQRDYTLAKGSGKRILTGTLALLAPPAKALKPEYTMADISATDWAFAAANVALIGLGLAPGAITGSVAGKAIMVGASSTVSGLVSYQTVKNWGEMAPVERGIGIGVAALTAIPMLTTIGRNVRIGVAKPIPTVKGNIVSWKGLSVAGHPIIGKSGGKWVLGTRSLTIPEARLILDGYHPEMMLETKVFVNKSAMSKAGFTKAQVDYLTRTLKSRNLFVGKKSPWLDKKVLTEPTARLNAKEIDIIMRYINSSSKNVKDAHLLYGSPTMKAQLAPKLRGWRPIHDWDISLNLSQEGTVAWTKSLFKKLIVGGGGKYRINPKTPTLIEKRIGQSWKHIADIHSQEEIVGSAMNIAGSKLDATGTYSYGKMVSEPSITVNYPGVGKLRIMRLSESGVRKADTILRVRQTPKGTAFEPPARGIAQPGVPKDAADFYVILRTFRGEEIAEEWLKLWATKMGYTQAQLVKVLPNIRKAMLEVAANTPSDIIGYKFIPAKSFAVATGASPSVIVHIPSSLGASVSASLASRISNPIYPYRQSQSAKAQASVSATAYLVASKLPSPVISLPSPSVATSVPAKLPSPAISAVPSPSSIPSIVPSLLPTPSLVPSVTPSPYPPPPFPPLTPKPTPKPPIYPTITSGKDRGRVKYPKGTIVWLMGIFWKIIPPPYTIVKPISSRTPPAGVKMLKGTPQQTLTFIKGKLPFKNVSFDLGVVDGFIDVKNKRIVFSGEGEKTDVGLRDPSPTKGLALQAVSRVKIYPVKRKTKGKRKSERKLVQTVSTVR